MPRVLSDDKFQQAIKDGKIDRKATGEARRKESTHPEEPHDHPLIAQGKAMHNFARSLGDQSKAMESAVHELGQALKNQGGDTAAAVKVLTALISQNNALVRQMMINMAEMHMQKETHGKSRRVVISVKRTMDRLIDSLEFNIEG